MGRELLIVIAGVILLLAIFNVWPPTIAQHLVSRPRIEKIVAERAEKAKVCREHNLVEPLARRVEGATFAIAGEAESYTKTRVTMAIKQALPGASVFIDGVQEVYLGMSLPIFSRSRPPATAIVVTVSEIALVPPPDPKTTGRTIDSYQQVVVRKASGVQLGSWQGMLEQSDCPAPEPREKRTSLAEFFASKPAGSSRVLDRPPKQPELKVEYAASSDTYVARPQDFEELSASPDCPASFLPGEPHSDKKLTVPTPGGTVWFTGFDNKRAMPAIVCGAMRTAVLFRAPGTIAVVSLDNDGNLLGTANIQTPATSESEAFRDVRIEGNTVKATLVEFALDGSGVMRSTRAGAVTATLDPSVQEAIRHDVVRHTACDTPPTLDHDVAVWEVSGFYAGNEYVQRPQRAPVPFTYLVADAPLRPLALSLRGTRTKMVWFIHVTEGTDLRYVEVNDSTFPQVVLVSGTARSLVNIATKADCATLFGRKSPGRGRYLIHNAFDPSADATPLKTIRSTDVYPYGDTRTVEDLLSPLGYRYFSRLADYFKALENEGVLTPATTEDLDRFRRYYYEGMPLKERVASWFAANPALDLQSDSWHPVVLARGEVMLPEHRIGATDDGGYTFLIDRQVPMPTGMRAPFLILDANSLSCAGRFEQCPWRDAPVSRFKIR